MINSKVPVIDDFNENIFDAQWRELAEEDKSVLLANALLLPPESAIIPVLKGISSYHFNVRNSARKALQSIRDQVNKSLSDPQSTHQYQTGLNECTSICARIFAQIDPEISFSDMGFYVKTLLSFHEKGAFFTFQAVVSKRIPLKAFHQIVFTLPDRIRLDLIFQYLQSPPAVRLEWAGIFKRMVVSLKKRDAVIQFFAWLFDGNRQMDPFLYNIDPGLRNPDLVMSEEIRSAIPEKQILGIKALSMITGKVNEHLMIQLLSEPMIQSVRMVVYKVIENSDKGTYQGLFTPVLKQCIHCKDDAEAFSAFKALITTGKRKVYEVVDLIQQHRVSLIPMIHEEISQLTRFSFLFIQDMAQHPDPYRTSHRSINDHCIFGMIKKRPERILRILKKYDDDAKDSVRLNITAFIEKIKSLYEKEKQNIETGADRVVEQVTKKAEASGGLIKTLFFGPKEKKVESIIKENLTQPVDFDEEIIGDADFSGTDFTAASFCISRSMFSNCDFSHTVFDTAALKGSVFYNVDMSHARFDQTIFDNTVFINVKMKHAMFKNCSFQKTSFFNCSFARAKISHAGFVQAVISRTSFNRCYLDCTTFAFSRMSAISFVTSNLEMVDFEGVKARFCRFPIPVRSHVHLRMVDIDYNARRYQLRSDDVPKLSEPVVSQINDLIFSEFIHFGEIKFLMQNKHSLLTAFDIFKPVQAELFQLIPLLLHENIIFPGFEKQFKKLSGPVPCGIFEFIPDPAALSVLGKYVRKSQRTIRYKTQYAVEGLFTIGSTGSIAQTSDSDIDWWVCINEKQLSTSQIQLLRKKLNILEQIAIQRFNTHVTFFIVDIVKTRKNDFGDSSIESSGSAQARLLKEEFYRTMIYVAGKIPFWSVLSTSVSINYYNSILNTISAFPNLTRYIDLGDIHAISTSEYFGASIWQMFKWLKSPFKSVIKMALLEKFIFEYGRKSLLCNQYKDKWMNAGIHLRFSHNDAYYILLKQLIHYYEKRNDTQSVNLLLTCFFLKLGLSKESQVENSAFGLKKHFLDSCVKEWGWTREKVFEVGNFKTWAYSDIARLSNLIETYMIKKYKTIHKAYQSSLHKQKGITLEDQTLLGRKVLVEFSKQPGKVGKVLLVSRGDRHFQSLQLKYFPPGDTGHFSWQLLNKNKKALHHREEALVTATTIEEIGAWLIINNLYSQNMVINLVPNPAYVTFDDIRKLYRQMYDFFDPFVNKTIHFNELLKKKRVMCLFVSVNFYAPKTEGKITGYCAVYLNTWGEMFCEVSAPGQQFTSMASAKKDIMSRISIKQLPLNTVFYFSKGAVR